MDSPHMVDLRASVPIILLVPMLALTAGCGKEEQKPREPAPRPVTVISLTRTEPSRLERQAGTVGSWKTEEMGFEVSGRVEFVIEPGTEIEGGMFDLDDEGAQRPRVLARLDDTRYQLAKASAEAQIRMAKEQRQAIQIEIDKVIPAKRKAAVAQRNLASVEVERNKKLASEGAGSKRDLDRAEAQLERGEADILQIDASLEAKKAERASMDARLQELDQALKEAERDIADCELRSPYRGQIAEVHVIPGAFVDKGQRVVTVQMMDPIKVEFEVSATTRRNLNYRDRVPVHVPMADGTPERILGLLYMTDPVADPSTRTFTVTLLLRNRKIAVSLGKGADRKDLVRTSEIWGVVSFDTAKGSRLFVNETSLQGNADGKFIFRITNRDSTTVRSRSESRLVVEKVRVRTTGKRVSFLGLWTFASIEPIESGVLVPDRDLVTGRLLLPEGQDVRTWKGNEVMYDFRRWLVQPGDVVQVDLEGQDREPGFYVPLSAIVERSGSTCVFIADDAGGVARRVPISVHDRYRILRRVEPLTAGALEVGAAVVADGALFLVDGEKIRVVGQAEVRR